LYPQIVTIFEVDICGIFLPFFRELKYLKYLEVWNKSVNHRKERWIMKNIKYKIKKQLMEAYLKE